MEDADVVCTVCRSGAWGTDDPILLCDGLRERGGTHSLTHGPNPTSGLKSTCNLAVHASCYGVRRVPVGKWFCDTCVAGVNPSCFLCGEDTNAGVMKPLTHTHAHTHTGGHAQAPGHARADTARETDSQPAPHTLGRTRSRGAAPSGTESVWVHVVCALTCAHTHTHTHTLAPFTLPDAHAHAVNQTRQRKCDVGCRYSSGGVDEPAPCPVTLTCAAPGCRVCAHTHCAVRAGLRIDVFLPGHAGGSRPAPVFFCTQHTRQHARRPLAHAGLEPPPKTFGVCVCGGAVNFDAWWACSGPRSERIASLAGKSKPASPARAARHAETATGVRRPSAAALADVNVATAGKIPARDGSRMRRAVLPEDAVVDESPLRTPAWVGASQTSISHLDATKQALRKQQAGWVTALADLLDAIEWIVRSTLVQSDRTPVCKAEAHEVDAATAADDVPLTAADELRALWTFIDEHYYGDVTHAVRASQRFGAARLRPNDEATTTPRVVRTVEQPAAAADFSQPKQSCAPHITPVPTVDAVCGRTRARTAAPPAGTAGRPRPSPDAATCADPDCDGSAIHTGSASFTLRVTNAPQHSSPGDLHPTPISFRAEVDVHAVAGLYRGVDVGAAKKKFSKCFLEKWFPDGPAMYVSGAHVVGDELPLLLEWQGELDEEAVDLHQAAAQAVGQAFHLGAMPAAESHGDVTLDSLVLTSGDACTDIDAELCTLQLALEQCVQARKSHADSMMNFSLRVALDAADNARCGIVATAWTRVYALFVASCIVCGLRSKCTHRHRILTRVMREKLEHLALPAQLVKRLTVLRNAWRTRRYTLSSVPAKDWAQCMQLLDDAAVWTEQWCVGNVDSVFTLPSAVLPVVKQYAAAFAAGVRPADPAAAVAIPNAMTVRTDHAAFFKRREQLLRAERTHALFAAQCAIMMKACNVIAEEGQHARTTSIVSPYGFLALAPAASAHAEAWALMARHWGAYHVSQAPGASLAPTCSFTTPTVTKLRDERGERTDITLHTAETVTPACQRAIQARQDILWDVRQFYRPVSEIRRDAALLRQPETHGLSAFDWQQVQLCVDFLVFRTVMRAETEAEALPCTDASEDTLTVISTDSLSANTSLDEAPTPLHTSRDVTQPYMAELHASVMATVVNSGFGDDDPALDAVDAILSLHLPVPTQKGCSSSFCLCKQLCTNDRVCIRCAGCGALFHADCVGLSPFQAVFNVLSFACLYCQRRAERRTFVRHHDDGVLRAARAAVLRLPLNPAFRAAYLGDDRVAERLPGAIIVPVA